MNDKTLFDLPNAPEQIGVVLPAPSLRKIDYSALDFSTARRSIIEYIQTYYPDQFNDFVASNGIMMLAEIVAATVAKLALRSDLQANEAFLPTATTEEAVVNHLALINQKFKRQTPATVDVEISLNTPLISDMVIEAGQTLETVGPDNDPVIYEIFRAPGDYTSPITIPAGKRAVIAYGLEGETVSPVTLTSTGGANQVYVITDDNILSAPVSLRVNDGDIETEWMVTEEPIEKYGPNDKVVEISFVNSNVYLRFGDGINGEMPESGDRIYFGYRKGGGLRGRVGVGQLQDVKSIIPLPPITASIAVRFRNVTPSSGGMDKESIEQAKKRAARDYAVREAIVTAEDYAQVASAFTHPSFGTMSKAVATVRTGLNANLVELYCLAEGTGSIPVTPSLGLKTALATYCDQYNVLTDVVEVKDGLIRYIDLDMTVVIKPDADASLARKSVEAAIADFFKLSRWEMGQPFYVSNLVEAVEAIDYVAYLDLFKPTDNVAKSDLAFNEMIALGDTNIRYYYESV